MKITKELLARFKLASLSLEQGGESVLCFLERAEKGSWFISTSRNCGFEKGGTAALRVFFEGEEETLSFEARIDDMGEGWITATPDVKTLFGKAKEFHSELSKMEERYEAFGRRKEERVKIGKENARKFGLSSVEQSVFLPAAKVSQPCAIVDASVHGICVITPETPALKSEENFVAKISFANPEETVLLKVHKVYSRTSKTERAAFATVSCQLLEPIHYAWKERVLQMIMGGGAWNPD